MSHEEPPAATNGQHAQPDLNDVVVLEPDQSEQQEQQQVPPPPPLSYDEALQREELALSDEARELKAITDHALQRESDEVSPASEACFFDGKAELDAAIRGFNSFANEDIPLPGYEGWIAHKAIALLYQTKAAMRDILVSYVAMEVPKPIAQLANKSVKVVATELAEAIRNRMRKFPAGELPVQVNVTANNHVQIVWQVYDAEHDRVNVKTIWDAYAAKEAKRVKFDEMKDRKGLVCWQCLTFRGEERLFFTCECRRALWIQRCQFQGSHLPTGLTEEDVELYQQEQVRKAKQTKATK